MHIFNSRSAGHIVNSPEAESARDEFMNKVKELCKRTTPKACKVKEFENDYGVKSYRITFKDGWYFQISTDPSVVEVQTKPSTVAQLKARRERIQEYIFDAARSVKLLPAEEAWPTVSWAKGWAGSHIHTGLESSVGSDLLFFRDYVVDYANHPELALGIFSNDSLNAPPIASLSAPQQEAFKTLIADVDAGKIRSIKVFAKRLRREVYYANPTKEMNPPTKYQAFNVNRIGNKDFEPDQQTFETRAHASQKNADEFVVQCELYEHRLEYVRQNRGKIELLLPSPSTMNQFSKAASFYRYVTEAGLDFKPYEAWLTPAQRNYVTTAVVPSCGDLFKIAN